MCAATPAGAQSVASLFTTLPADFGHLFVPSTAIVLGIGGAASAAVHPQDDEIAVRIGATEGARVKVFRAGHVLGDSPAQAALALGVYVAGRMSGRPGLGAAGADLVDAQIVNGVLTQGIKVGVDRTRPNGSRYSFPSGHTSATFATAAVIHAHYGWKVATPFYALGTYVGVSRMVDRKHFASDVIFGAALGIVSGRAAAFGHGRNRVTVSPTLSPSRVGIVGRIGG